MFSTLVLSFWQLVERRWSDICNTIEFSSLPFDLKISEELVQTIEESLTPDSSRAKQLREIFKGGMKNVAKRIWPGVFSCI